MLFKIFIVGVTNGEYKQIHHWHVTAALLYIIGLFMYDAS